MSDWKNLIPQAAQDYIAGRRLDEVECIVADIAGVARGKAMPASKFEHQDRFFLPNSIFLQTITGEWTDNPTGAFTEPDMILTPDWSTAAAAPWTADITLMVIHDVKDQQGNPVTVAPRNVLKRILALFEAEGWRPIVAPEMEFFLVARNLDPNQPIIPPMGRSGRRAAGKQAYSMSAVDEYGKVIDDIYDFAEAQGFEIDGILQEGGAGQVEINLAHGDPVHLADQIFYFKRLIREAALRHDCFATFMAKPIEGEPGSAMHVHQSIVDIASGRNLFSNPDGSPSRAFDWYIGGLQKYIPAAMALFAPYVNSYRRLVRATAAPINIQWGTDNRTVGIRAPLAPPAARRIENRVIGADANPYVALAATLACGWLGLKNRIEPTPECKGDAYLGAFQLPRSLSEALSLLRAEGDLAQVLGEAFVTVYTEVKETEHEEFMRVISPWEREHLLLHV